MCDATDIREIVTIFVEHVGQLKEMGIINDDQYERLTIKKVAFLNSRFSG